MDCHALNRERVIAFLLDRGPLNPEEETHLVKCDRRAGGGGYIYGGPLSVAQLSMFRPREAIIAR